MQILSQNLIQSRIPVFQRRKYLVRGHTQRICDNRSFFPAFHLKLVTPVVAITNLVKAGVLNLLYSQIMKSDI
jgi:hypothetical protein